jgi:hypothetical protein
MTNGQEEKEKVYVEYGIALDCLERLSDGQLKILRAAIDSELEGRQGKVGAKTCV